MPVLTRIKSLLKLMLATFVLSFAIIWIAVVVGWLDEPLNGWIESNARKDMGWLDRTLLSLSDPQDPMTRARREDFDLVKGLGAALGMIGGIIAATAMVFADGLFGFTKTRKSD